MNNMPSILIPHEDNFIRFDKRKLLEIRDIKIISQVNNIIELKSGDTHIKLTIEITPSLNYQDIKLDRFNVIEDNNTIKYYFNKENIILNVDYNLFIISDDGNVENMIFYGIESYMEKYNKIYLDDFKMKCDNLNDLICRRVFYFGIIDNFLIKDLTNEESRNCEKIIKLTLNKNLIKNIEIIKGDCRNEEIIEIVKMYN